MLAWLVNTCWVHVLQVSNDPKGHITLRDTWFEDFGHKIPVLRLLNCHNSPRRANSLPRRAKHSSWSVHSQPTRNGELVNSQWQVSKLAMASYRETAPCLFASGPFWRTLVQFLRTFFYSIKPLNIWLQDMDFKNVSFGKLSKASIHLV